MHAETAEFTKINSVKANFDAIYHHPDPREYFRVLGGLDYVIPDLAKIPFRSLAAARATERQGPLKIADLGCSYGINAALLRYPLDIKRLAQRYAAREVQNLDASALALLDRHYFRAWPECSDASIIGIDTARDAVEYALQAGLIDGAVTSNLEELDPTPHEAQLLGGLDLVISTGCVGYTTEKSMHRILSAQGEGESPWVASFVLRMFPYDAIAAELARFGLVTEKLEGVTFVQRRFHSEREFASTLKSLDRMGIDPDGKESEGLYHAELYVSRPQASIDKTRLGDLISVTSGAGLRFGRRYARRRGQIKLMQ